MKILPRLRFKRLSAVLSLLLICVFGTYSALKKKANFTRTSPNCRSTKVKSVSDSSIPATSRSISEADFRFSRPGFGELQVCDALDVRVTSKKQLNGIIGLLDSPEMKHLGTSPSRIDLDVLAHLSEFQLKSSVCGPVAEIGVYKGWFVAALASILASSSDYVYAFDLFHDQVSNVDGSGGGKTHAPQVKHLRYVVGQVNASERVVTVQGNSLDLSPQELIAFMGFKPRFVSIDGGHFRIAAFHDLNMVSRIMHPAGIVALDDYDNVGWSGVKVALATFIAIWGDDLQPFLATDAKLYMCKKESHDEHLAAVKQWFSTSKVCSGSHLNMQADHRVDLDQEKILQFVDLTTMNAGIGKFC